MGDVLLAIDPDTPEGACSHFGEHGFTLPAVRWAITKAPGGGPRRKVTPMIPPPFERADAFPAHALDGTNAA